MQACANEVAGIRLELPAEATSVSRARAAVTEYARSVGAEPAAVELAVSEAVGNAVIHAFRGRDAGMIHVSASTSGPELVVIVADDGAGMIPDLESRGLGFGVSLISQLSAEAKFQASDAGTTVTMSFALREPGQGGDAAHG